MSKEELNEIYESIQFQMICEQHSGYRKEYSKSFQEKISLYNYVIELEEKINKLKDKVLCYGETFDSDIHQQFQREFLQIIDKVGGNE